MLSRVAAFFVWALVAASLAFWGLKLLVRPDGLPREALPVSLEQAVRGDLARLFPAPVVRTAVVEQPALASRLKVVGVIAPRSQTADSGIALISLDGRPPRAVRIGDRVDRREDLVLHAITQTQVIVGPQSGDARVTLTLPGLPPPAVGSLPPPERLTEPPSGPRALAR